MESQGNRAITFIASSNPLLPENSPTFPRRRESKVLHRLECGRIPATLDSRFRWNEGHQQCCFALNAIALLGIQVLVEVEVGANANANSR